MNEQNKSWFARNWPWAVPAGGCLTVLILGIVILVITFSKFPDLISKTEPISYAIQTTIVNEEALEALGEPIEVDQSQKPEGEMSLRNKDGKLEMVFPLKGPKDTATLHINAEKENDEWSYNDLYILVNSTGEKIELEKPNLDDL
ncbi:MAG: cytochrome c oxidase assembly factor Coa1 family protein [bacterium]